MRVLVWCVLCPGARVRYLEAEERERRHAVFVAYTLTNPAHVSALVWQFKVARERDFGERLTIFQKVEEPQVGKERKLEELPGKIAALCSTSKSQISACTAQHAGAHMSALVCAGLLARGGGLAAVRGHSGPTWSAKAR